MADWFTNLNPWLAIAIVMVALGVLIVLANCIKSSHEVSRKMVHVGMGLVCLSFPWVFRDTWPVLLLGAIAVGSLLGVRLVPGLRKSVGACLHEVKRESFGELYFALSVALLFWLSGGDKILFCVPLLILTAADAAGALIGIGYGKTAYATTDGRKSAEGSTTFFLIAFLCALIPLLLFTETGRAETLLISLTMAFMVTLVEAISTRGLDNLLIPLGSLYLLTWYLDMNLEELLWRLTVLNVLLIVVLFLRKRSSLNGSSLLGSVLLGYGAQILGGWPFLAPLLLLFLSHIRATGMLKKKITYEHNMRAVFCIAFTSMLWLSVHQYRDALAPFLMGIAAHFAILNVNTLHSLIPEASNWRRLLQSSLKACGLTYLPVAPFFPNLWIQLVVAIPLTMTGSAIFSHYFQAKPRVSTAPARWIIQAVIATLISLFALLFKR